MARWLLAPLLLALITTLPTREVNRGNKAPPFTAKDVTGKTVKLADFRASRTFSWSSGHRMPHRRTSAVQKLQEEHQKKPLVVWAPASVARRGTIDEVGQDRKLNLRLLRDPERDLADRYETAVTPTFF